MIPLRSELLFTLRALVSPPLELGVCPLAGRRIYTAQGGDFEGPKLRGTIVPGGGDWMLVDAEGIEHLDVRIVLQTDDDEQIYMSFRGLRHGPATTMARLARGEPVEPSEYYFRIAPFFETASKRYAWLNRILTVGIGHRVHAGPIYYIYEIL